MFSWLVSTRNKNWLPPVTKEDGSKTHVFVGVSGGVDSSVSAAILKNRGYEVTGVFMKTYYPPELQCDWRDERLDAMRVCEHLQVPFLDCDLESEYKDNVFDYMINSYKKGITPNPDVFCNKYVKFGGFLDWAILNGADYIATGHYAQHFFQNKRDSSSTSYVTNSLYQRYTSFLKYLSPRLSSRLEKNIIENNLDAKIHSLGKGMDTNKDQTYFLYQLRQSQLEKSLFPIGGMEKSQVRKLAKKYGLFTHEKKDSQGVCFVGPVEMHDFLKNYIDEEPGDVLDETGQVIGEHDGSFFLTIGQRTGFEIAPEHRTANMPRMFVVAKDTENNTVTVSANKRSRDSHVITIDQASWVGDVPQPDGIFESRIRHRGKLLSTKVEGVSGTRFSFSFENSHEGVASGQSLVLYKDSACVGGGIVVG